MNSVERKRGRYKRRQEKRNRNKLTFATEISSFTYVFRFWEFLLHSLKCCNGVRWKASVQRFELRLTTFTYRTKQRLEAHTWKPKRASHFLLFDAGKLRQIDSVNIHTRAVQRTICYRCIMPIAERTATGKGFAARKGLGTDAAIRYFAEALRSSASTDLVWSYDFSSFFASVLHAPLKQVLQQYALDATLLYIVSKLFALFGERGLQLGSHFSQCLVVLLGGLLDSYVACQLHVKLNGRYSDDGFMILHTVEDVETISTAFIAKTQTYGLSLNTKKVHTKVVSSQHTFLKKRFNKIDSAVVIRLPKQSMPKQRRRLKRLFDKYDSKCVSLLTIVLAYNAWNAYAAKLKSNESRVTLYRFMIGKLNERGVQYEVKRHYLLGLPGKTQLPGSSAAGNDAGGH